MLGGRGPGGAAAGPGCHTTGWYAPTGSVIAPIQPGTRISTCWRFIQSAAPTAITNSDPIASLRIAASPGMWQCAGPARRKAMIALYPTPDQIQALLKDPSDRPVVMLNLLRFKDRATRARRRPHRPGGLPALCRRDGPLRDVEGRPRDLVGARRRAGDRHERRRLSRWRR
jgi:hypothetical protein